MLKYLRNESVCHTITDKPQQRFGEETKKAKLNTPPGADSNARLAAGRGA